ncbi:MAG: hypothetical protein M1825_002953 [Sarcosagium campestre]|nr:MAG: hypothetical protein M1825_002953 [Sarcosagium campestre]
MREIDPLISAYSHLKEKPREAEALHSLQKIASLVKPVMRQRGWRVGTLREFYPTERNLLGVNWNRGQEICLRLRYPSDERQFLPLEQVVDTMLHELSHIVHDKHDAKFHALWQQLRDEQEGLQRKGYTGEGFLSKGHKLGGRRIPMDEARRRARASAEKRKVISAGSGQRLGGAPVRRGADMRKVIADATQRRLTVTKGCASGTKDSQAVVEQATRNGFRTQAEEDDANERAIMEAYIELMQQEEKEKWGDQYTAASAQNPSGSASDSAGPSKLPSPDKSSDRDVHLIDDDSNGDDDDGDHSNDNNGKDVKKSRPPEAEAEIESDSSSSSPSTASSVTLSASSSTPSKTRKRPRTLSPNTPAVAATPPPSSVSSKPIMAQWSCSTCTLDNPVNFLCCGACGTERPSEGVIPDDDQAPYRQQPNLLSSSTGTTASAAARLNSSAWSSASSRQSGFWTCHRCGTDMEAQWWTCSTCGAMKLSS